jgi:hypothetical protein
VADTSLSRYPRGTGAGPRWCLNVTNRRWWSATTAANSPAPHPDMGRSQPRRMALHRAGQSHAERLHREFQWAVEGRAPERAAVHVAAQASIGCWRADSNRINSQLGWEFAFTCHPRRGLAPRYVESSAPAPVAITAPTGYIQQPGRNQDWIKLGARSIRPESARRGCDCQHARCSHFIAYSSCFWSSNIVVLRRRSSTGGGQTAAS